MTLAQAPARAACNQAQASGQPTPGQPEAVGIVTLAHARLRVTQQRPCNADIAAGRLHCALPHVIQQQAVLAPPSKQQQQLAALRVLQSAQMTKVGAAWQEARQVTL